MSPDIQNMVSNVIMVLVPMILSLTVHEFAHALAARQLGDDTAEAMGRLTLNPVSHIDPVGTLILPIALVIFGGGFFFGWAKPVPFNPTRFTRKINMRTGAMIVAAAGPLSNLLLAVICMGAMAAVYHSGTTQLPEFAGELLRRMVWINVALAVFNMIPVYPLDGQKVLTGVLPTNTAIEFERFSQRYGSMLLMGVIFFAGRVITVPLHMLLSGLAAVFGMPSV